MTGNMTGHVVIRPVEVKILPKTESISDFKISIHGHSFEKKPLLGANLVLGSFSEARVPMHRVEGRGSVQALPKCISHRVADLLLCGISNDVYGN